MEIGTIKEALDQILAENVELKRQNEELTQKLSAIATTLNGSFVPAHAEMLAEGNIVGNVVEVSQQPEESRGGRRKHRLDKATRKAIAMAYSKQKKPVKEIVTEFNVSPYIVYSTLKKLGVSVRG